MRRFATAFASLLLAASLAAATPPCSDRSDYASALCHYLRHDYEGAEKAFATIVEAAAETPETIRAEYFLARTRMQLKRYSEASAGLIKIYSLDPAFYKEWGCDHLLGESRRAMGLE